MTVTVAVAVAVAAGVSEAFAPFVALTVPDASGVVVRIAEAEAVIAFGVRNAVAVAVVDAVFVPAGDDAPADEIG